MTATKTKKKKPQVQDQTDVAKLQSTIERYETFFEEIESFVGFIRGRRDELSEAIAEEARLKELWETAKDRRRQIEYAIDGAKDGLYTMIEPGAMDFMPLFDRMEPADPEKHGENASEWRKEPIAALDLSPLATRLLVDAQIIVVGQLQDRVLENGTGWFSQIEGMTNAVAAAVVDRLNDFIFKKEKGSE